MAAKEWTMYSALILIVVWSAVDGVCTVPWKVRGTWDVMDASRTNVEFTVTITSSGLQGVTFWNKSLQYDCFDQRNAYYLFVSELTDLFDLYNVNIYFCWYLTSSGSSYRVFELTNKVLNSVEQRAKAYLNTTVPTRNDVCEVSYDSSLSYKEMQVPFNP